MIEKKVAKKSERIKFEEIIQQDKLEIRNLKKNSVEGVEYGNEKGSVMHFRGRGSSKQMLTDVNAKEIEQKMSFSNTNDMVSGNLHNERTIDIKGQARLSKRDKIWEEKRKKKLSVTQNSKMNGPPSRNIMENIDNNSINQVNLPSMPISHSAIPKEQKQKITDDYPRVNIPTPNYNVNLQNTKNSGYVKIPTPQVENRNSDPQENFTYNRGNIQDNRQEILSRHEIKDYYGNAPLKTANAGPNSAINLSYPMRKEMNQAEHPKMKSPYNNDWINQQAYAYSDNKKMISPNVNIQYMNSLQQQNVSSLPLSNIGPVPSQIQGSQTQVMDYENNKLNVNDNFRRTYPVQNMNSNDNNMRNDLNQWQGGMNTNMTSISQQRCSPYQMAPTPINSNPSSQNQNTKIYTPYNNMRNLTPQNQMISQTNNSNNNINNNCYNNPQYKIPTPYIRDGMTGSDNINNYYTGNKLQTPYNSNLQLQAESQAMQQYGQGNSGMNNNNRTRPFENFSFKSSTPQGYSQDGRANPGYMVANNVPSSNKFMFAKTPSYGH